LEFEFGLGFLVEGLLECLGAELLVRVVFPEYCLALADLFDRQGAKMGERFVQLQEVIKGGL
jgi:hypothetical protein